MVIRHEREPHLDGHRRWSLGRFDVSDDEDTEPDLLLATWDSEDDVDFEQEEIPGFGFTADQAVALGAELVRAGTEVGVSHEDEAMTAVVAFLETDENERWFSVHLSEADAWAKLQEVAKAWKVEVTMEPQGKDTGVRQWYVGGHPVLGSWESAQPPEAAVLVGVANDPDGTLLSTFKMLAMKDARGGLSAEELADDLDVTEEEASRRLAGLAERGTIDEVFPRRYRVPASSRYSER